MKKKYIIITTIVIIAITAFITYSSYLKNNNVFKEKNVNEPVKVTKGISMMLEQTAGVGDYKTTTQSDWPIDGYKFNSKLSRCENGSELSWDDTRKVVTMSGNLTDKCYVYFDLILPLLQYVKLQYTGVQGENNMYFHDGTLENGIDDNSYRYAGSSESTNNFICFGSTANPCPTDNLYRIIGVIDDKVKLIKYDYATSAMLGTDGDYNVDLGDEYNHIDSTYKGELSIISTYSWNYKATNSWVYAWNSSLLNKTNLNTNFINALGTTWSSKIITTTWKIGGNLTEYIEDKIPKITYQYEIVNPDDTFSVDSTTTYNAKIGLVYVSDYGFAASPEAWTLLLSDYNDTTATSNNWMYLGEADLTITRSTYASGRINRIQEAGYVKAIDAVSGAVRPVFNLNKSLIYESGDGTKNFPIRIES